MKFTRLALTGFKSFVNPGELIIEPGLTGIVGPNGCGKSNLLEALRWVMGENSFKNMRGTGMEDVIFAGANTRASRNHAEVTLFIDNSDKTIPGALNAHPEIEISRRIERNKGSTYRINGREVRARDVQLFFADVSTGAHSPALVSQGRVGELIQAKPVNRRRVLEEAAGITGLYTRRHEAELRLKGAETNLTRLDDVTGQMEERLASLKKQTRQANRYRNLSGYIRETQAMQLHLHWEAARKALEQQEARLEETRSQVTQLTEAASVAARAQSEANAELLALKERDAASLAALQRLTVEQENLDAEDTRTRAQATRLRDTVEQIAQDMERERRQITETQATITQLTEEEKTLEHDRQKQDALQTGAEGQVREAEETLHARENALDALSAQIASLAGERQTLEHTRQQARARLEKLTAQQQAQQQEHHALSDARLQHHALVQQREQADEVATASRMAAEAAAEADEVAQQARAEEARTREPMLETQRALEKLTAEAQALGDLLAVDEGGFWPPMIDLITVEPGFETALGAALGEDLNVPTDENAPAYWSVLPPLAHQTALPEGVEELGNHVKAPPSLGRRLSHIGLVDKTQGRALHTRLAPGQCLVSQAGDVWRWDGYTAAADAPTATAKRLKQRNRLTDLEQEITHARQHAREARTVFEEKRTLARDATETEKTLRRTLHDAQARHAEIRAQLAEQERQSTEQVSRLTALTETGRRIEDDLAETRHAMEEASNALSLLQPDTELRQQHTEIREHIARLRLDVSRARSVQETLNREAHDRTHRLEAIAQERATWQTRMHNGQTQLETLDARRQEAGTELETLRDIPAVIEEKRKALLSAVSETGNTRTGITEALAAMEKKLAECDRRVRETSTRLAQTREERAHSEGLVDGARERKTQVEARIEEELHCPAPEALAKANLKPGQELPELDAIERKLERLKRERENLGGVNLRAEEEVSEIQEQYDTLIRERTDLEEAIAKLRQGISSLNREGRERMQKAFETVNANFTRLFTHLFGGGTAHLALIDSDDPLQAGLEIMVRPPGKRLQTMSLLSGGEQALTALSLIFAVFLTNPSPICVLDEVDAPLDDANTERFCNLMDEMVRTTDTRFLLITHHVLTMARMHRLYGVTMQERGISTLVSVDLEAAEQLQEAS